MKVLSRIFRSKKFHRAVSTAKEEKGTQVNPDTASVMDYSSKRSLFSTLKHGNKIGGKGIDGKDAPTRESSPSSSPTADRKSVETTPSSDDAAPAVSSKESIVEWKLPIADYETTIPQTMEDEYQRLQVLKSYLVLDTKSEIEFDRITNMAAKVFDAPICLVSLVDLGRQWFKSKVGLDATETPRKFSFCAHVVQSKHRLLIVKDATQDLRFKNNPLVTDGIKIRFYAGASLLSPEGYKLGSFCVISPNSRPQGLTMEEQEMLISFADIVIDVMVARRNRLIMEEQMAQVKELATTMASVAQSLKHAKKDIDSVATMDHPGLDVEDVVALSSATQELQVQSQLCSATARQLVESNDLKSVVKPVVNSIQEEDDKNDAATLEELIDSYDDILDPTTDMKKLYENLDSMVSTLAQGKTKTCSLAKTTILEMSKTVPTKIVAEDILLFKSCLNLIMNSSSSSASVTDASSGTTILRIRVSEDSRRSSMVGPNANGDDDEKFLIVECQDGGAPISTNAGKALFRNKDSPLYELKTMVRTLGGTCGVDLGSLSEIDGEDNENSECVKTIFWFQIPLELPKSASARTGAAPTFIGKAQRSVHKASIDTTTNTGKLHSDPFQEVTLESTSPHQRGVTTACVR